MKTFLGLVLSLLLSFQFTSMSYAQPVDLPEAEQNFQVALRAFESQDYAVAFYGFREVYELDPAHLKTTAAYLMAGKALYRLGNYLPAIELLEDFRAQYPTSRYLLEAASLIRASKTELQRVEFEDNIIRIGLALPLTPDEFAVTRSIFQGVKLAVDTYNLQSEQKVKIIFRDTGDSSEGARSAATALVDQGVSAMIGPLFSDQVAAAAHVTEAEQTVLIAPLATENNLTQDRRHVFQVNTTLAERGRFIARQAIDYLNLTDFGIVTEAGDDVSKEMARGFTEELDVRGFRPVFTYEVTSSADWPRLAQLIQIDTLSAADGIYFSVYHDNQNVASRLIQDAVSSLGHRRLRPYILGPSAWHSLNLARLGTSMAAFYVDVYYLSDKRMNVRRFIRAYMESNEGMKPDRLAYVGYDIAGMLLENLERGGSLRENLMSASLYEGVGIRIQFGEERRNTALYLFEYTPGGPQLVR